MKCSPAEMYRWGSAGSSDRHRDFRFLDATTLALTRIFDDDFDDTLTPSPLPHPSSPLLFFHSLPLPLHTPPSSSHHLLLPLPLPLLPLPPLLLLLPFLFAFILFLFIWSRDSSVCSHVTNVKLSLVLLLNIIDRTVQKRPLLILLQKHKNHENFDEKKIHWNLTDLGRSVCPAVYQSDGGSSVCPSFLNPMITAD